MKVLRLFQSRDWSAWIDTIETFSGETPRLINPFSSGLICLNWYDWNLFIKAMSVSEIVVVGIDLPELIRLKQYFSIINKTHFLPRRDWSAWIDTIETSSCKESKVSYYKSGLICLNWYDWN